MRKLAMAAAAAILVTATPVVAEGGGGSGQSAKASGPFGQAVSSVWQRSFFTPPGFFSPGKHWGWFFGKHWGWFKPHHPNWPHHPPHSP